MATSLRNHRWALALGLSVAVAAALHAGDREGGADPPARRAQDARATMPAPAPALAPSAETLPRLDIERLDALAHRHRGTIAAVDPFAVAASVEARALAVAAPSPPPPPAPPQAPPIPFRFIGAQEIDGAKLVFLEQQNRTHIARPGEEVAEGWRLDSVTERSIIFTYVPLGQQSTLALGGAN